MYIYQRGVTLVELMVVVVIIGILMSVAVPSYRQYTMRANRAEGHWTLLQASANQERFYLQNNTYATNGELTDPPPAGLGLPSTTESGFYDINITNADGAGFTVVATAQGGQAEDTDCDVLSINERGVRYGGPGPAGSMSNDQKCW
jgi:type IV pilus assembly protein PilE